MELVENWMFAQGCQEIKLTTEIGTRAERLYRRRGWKPGGTLGEREICLILRR
jgi:hypothetical protein